MYSMRKRNKQIIYELLNTLCIMHGQLQENGMDTFISCQKTAIEAGNMIEASEGEGTRAVSYLEEYCEMIYQLSLLNGKSGSKIRDNLNQIVRKVKKEVADFSISVEAVFLPYKYSMWDSLESVWRAALEDPVCDAYVVPIPYFDRNTDGSFGEVHYEGGLFPPSIPTIYFNDYNIEQRHPDFIFIHNPYDEHNLVTSVHPEYYAKKLCKETESLIYIPYDLPPDETVHNNYVFLDGIIFSHKVIVRSEKIRRQYIRMYKEMFLKLRMPQIAEGAEEKFAALGSPKEDKIIYGIGESRDMPLEWRAKIGTGNNRKKVVLYNTHINNLMYLTGKSFLRKIKEVFQIFRDKNDAILLWRPHPLSIATIKAMNPGILNEYLDIICSFKKEDWGIYDDTSDFEKAVIVSDAYYGDGGSLWELYKITGKPMLRQSID